MPIASAKNHGNHDRVRCLVALHGSGHFAIVAIIRGYEVWAHEQEDYVGRLHSGINGSVDFLTGTNTTIMPSTDDALPLQHGELFF